MTDDSSPADRPLADLAQQDGSIWQQHSYYQDAEPHMDDQWEAHIWPLIADCDFSRVVDLAAGRGRNSAKLVTVADSITVVDLHQENVDACRERFAGSPKFDFLVNNGTDLRPIPDDSISLVYCFDAMVHFDSDIVRSYLMDCYRVLRSGGRGFIHHSNLSSNPGGSFRDNPGYRNFMSRELFEHYCVKAGLRVLQAKVIWWERDDLDCLTLFEKPAE